jgi:hypothetical protein
MFGELPGELVELSLGSPPLELAVIDRANSGRIITTIFKPLQTVEQPLRNLRLSDYPDNSAH